MKGIVHDVFLWHAFVTFYIGVLNKHVVCDFRINFLDLDTSKTPTHRDVAFIDRGRSLHMWEKLLGTVLL